MPFPQMRIIAEVPGVESGTSVSEDEALNLVCDARQDEPHFPIKHLLKKLHR